MRPVSITAVGHPLSLGSDPCRRVVGAPREAVSPAGLRGRLGCSSWLNRSGSGCSCQHQGTRAAPHFYHH